MGLHTLWHQAERLIQAGKPAEAVAALESLLAEEPANGEAAYWLAWLLHDQGKISDAYRWARQALALGDVAERHLQVGWLLQCLGRHEDALGAYRTILSSGVVDEICARATSYAANCLAHLGRHGEAWTLLQQALSQQPGQPDLALELAALQRAMSAPQACLETVQALLGALSDAPSQGHLRARAWRTVGLVKRDAGDLVAADAAYRRSLENSPRFMEASFEAAVVCHARNDFDGAKRDLTHCLEIDPQHTGAHVLAAQIELAQGQLAAARRRVLQCLRITPRHAGLWRVLGEAQAAGQRPAAASRSALRAFALEPSEPSHTTAYLRYELSLPAASKRADAQAFVDAARRAHIVSAAAADADGIALAARAMARRGDWHIAKLWAEHALEVNPQTPWAWVVLAQAYAAHRVWAAAADSAQRALGIDPLMEAAWCLLIRMRIADGTPSQARQLAMKARRAGVDSPELRWLAARALHLLCKPKAALVEVNTAIQTQLSARPARLFANRHGQLLSLRAQLLAELNLRDLSAALQVCKDLLAEEGTLDEGLALAIWLVGLGSPQAQQLLARSAPGRVMNALQAALSEAVHTQGYWALQRLSACAAGLFPLEPWFACARLYAAALADEADPDQLLKQARDWSRQISAQRGIAQTPDGLGRPGKPRAKPRIAYLVRLISHWPMVNAVIAAHDPDLIEVHVFTSRAWPDLPAHAVLHDPDPANLLRMCRAFEVDALIETGGVQHYAKHDEVMEALAARVAPVQVGWMGTLMSSGGLFDVLLADDVSVRAGEECFFTERVERLAGGQWCWTPPAFAPPVAPAPCLACGQVTLGVVARSLRHGEQFLDTLARVMARNPTAQVAFIGEVWADPAQRRATLLALQQQGVADHRVRFDPPTSREGFWRWLSGVDLVLDTCPASGGLSLLETLWMGVPVVTCLGATLGSRQAASVLTALDREAWVAEDPNDLVRLTIALIGNKRALGQSRQALRGQMQKSTLLDGVRVARQIEALAEGWQQRASHVVASGGRPQTALWAQGLAEAAFSDWLEKPGARIAFERHGSSTPDVTVVVVLAGRVGTDFWALQALADQRDCTADVVVVSHAADLQTRALLSRVDGAHSLQRLGREEPHGAAFAAGSKARGRHIALLSSNVMLQPGALAAAVKALDADPLVGVVSGAILGPDGRLLEAGRRLLAGGTTVPIGRGEEPDNFGARVVRSTDCVSSAFVAVSAKAWESLGGVDERFASSGAQDADLCVRAWQAGFKVLYEPSIRLVDMHRVAERDDSADAVDSHDMKRFRRKHAGWLRSLPVASPSTALTGDVWDSPEDRTARRPRVLCVDDDAMIAYTLGDEAGLRERLGVWATHPITLFPMSARAEAALNLRPRRYSRVEAIGAGGLAGLLAFLEQRYNTYDVLWVGNSRALEAVLIQQKKRPDLFASMALVCGDVQVPCVSCAAPSSTAKT